MGWVTSKDLLERDLVSRFQLGQKKEGKEQQWSRDTEKINGTAGSYSSPDTCSGHIQQSIRVGGEAQGIVMA